MNEEIEQGSRKERIPIKTEVAVAGDRSVDWPWCLRPINTREKGKKTRESESCYRDEEMEGILKSSSTTTYSEFGRKAKDSGWIEMS
ncbi:hypothetical protein GQ457_07G021520 [Hibiscus cannabinus]